MLKKGSSSKNIFTSDAERRVEAARQDDVRKSSPPKKIFRMSYQHMAGGVLIKQSMQGADWSKSRILLFKITENVLFSILMGTIIVMNTVLIIHETDLKASGPGTPRWVAVASNVFLAIYVVEIVVRFYVRRRRFFRSFWNLLDLMVVITDCCAEVANLLGFEELPSVSALRIFRLTRLIRLVAMLTVFRELQTMLLGFGSAMKAMLWASLMIGVVLTSCSIVAVMLIHPLNVEVAKTGVYGDCDRCGRAFETVAESNLTFIQQIIAGDSWGQITIPIIEANPAAGVFFLVCFCIIDLGVINLVLMVIVNAAETAREANQDMQFRQKVAQIHEMKQKLKVLCQDLDSNKDGRISLDEFMMGCDENEELRRTMAGLDIQRQDAEIIYYLMDEDKSGDVDFNEFVGTMVATKHESLNTKLLFLKASMHQLHHDLIDQAMFLEEDVAAKMCGSGEVTEAVNCAMEEASAKMGPQWDKTVGEYHQSLAQLLDQHWEQLQMEQANEYQKLEKMVRELAVPLSNAVALSNGSTRQSQGTLSSLATLPPPSRTPSKVYQENAAQAAFLASTNHIHRQVDRTIPEHSPVLIDAAANWDIVNPSLYKTYKTSESRTHEN